MSGRSGPGAPARPHASPADQSAALTTTILALRNQGLGPTAIARTVGVSVQHVDRRLREARLAADLPPVTEPEPPRSHTPGARAFQTPPGASLAERVAWQERFALVERLDEAALFLPAGPVRSGLHHLADLHQHHATFYPSLTIPSEGVNPRLCLAVPAVTTGSSSAQACVDFG